MITSAKSPFTMALAMAFIATVLVPSTSEAKYRKRALPSACSAETTVTPFWEGKEIALTPGGTVKEPLFFVVMAALDPQTGGETPVAKAKWSMLCDAERERYKVWLEGVTRTAVYLVLDYRFDGPQVFGGSSYPDADGDSVELEAMGIDVIGDLLMKSLSELTVLDLVAAARPGTPHNGGTLGNFSSAVCTIGGVGCAKKPAAPVAVAPAAPKAIAKAPAAAAPVVKADPSATPAPTTCPDGKSVPPCPPPPAAATPDPSATAAPKAGESGEVH